MSQVAHEVISLVCPKLIGAAPPSRLEDPQFWKDAIGFAKQADCLESLVTLVSHSQWIERIPSAMRTLIEDEYFEILNFQSEIKSEYQQLSKILENNRIKVLSVGGFELWKNYYPANQYRHLGSIDWVAPRTELQNILRILGKEGYRQNCSTKTGKAILTKSRPNINKSSVQIGISHQLDSFSRLDRSQGQSALLAMIWDRSCYAGAATHESRWQMRLSWEDQLIEALYSGTHLGKLQSVQGLIDVFWLFQSLEKFKVDPDWDWIREHVSRLGLWNAAWLCQNTLKKIWDIALPEPWSQWVDAKASKLGRSTVLSWAKSEGAFSMRGLGPAQHRLTQFWLRSRAII